MSGKSDGKKPLRDEKGRFLPGNTGGPGRPQGEPCTTARVLRGQFSDKAEEVAQVVLDQALSGDLEAARIVLERIYPKPKDAAVQLEIPEAGTLTQKTEAILQAVADGQLTPSEGSTVAGIVTSHAKALEVEELKARMQSLERALNFRLKQERENAKSK
jgi:hypothetical protein